MSAITQMGEDIFNLLLPRTCTFKTLTVAEHNGHSDSFQVKFPKVFTNYPLGAVRVEDQRFKD